MRKKIKKRHEINIYLTIINDNWQFNMLASKIQILSIETFCIFCCRNNSNKAKIQNKKHIPQKNNNNNSENNNSAYTLSVTYYLLTNGSLKVLLGLASGLWVPGCLDIQPLPSYSPTLSLLPLPPSCPFNTNTIQYNAPN